MSRLLLTVILLALILPVRAQQKSSRSGRVPDQGEYGRIADVQAQYLNVLYNSRVSYTDELINGREYIPYYLKCRVRPLFREEEKRKGAVVFNGRKYDNRILEYDTFMDQLIYSDSARLINDRIFKIVLNSDLVDRFLLAFPNDTVRFINVRADRGNNSGLQDGYYEIAYDGTSRLLVRHQSQYIEKEGMYEYRYKPSEYFNTGDRFVKVKSRRAFLDLFGDRRDQVKKYMRLNGLHFRNAAHYELAAILKYYDSQAAK